MEKGKLLAISLVLLLAACATTGYRSPTAQPPEEWTGAWGWTLLGADAKVHEGARRPGDVLIEYPAKMTSTAVVLETVQTKNASGLDVVLPEGTKLFALNFRPHGQVVDVTEWCTVLPHGVDGKQKGSDTLCLFWEEPTRAWYQPEYRDGGFGFHPRMITNQRGMEGPVPRIKVQPVDFGVPLILRLHVVRIDPKEVEVEEVLSDGTSDSHLVSHTLRWDSGRKASYKDAAGEYVLTASEDYSSMQFAPLRQETAGPIVRVCVNESGALSGEPQVVVSSGSAQLDTAAIDYAKKGRYLPRQVNDGGDCFKFRVRFDLRER